LENEQKIQQPQNNGGWEDEFPTFQLFWVIWKKKVPFAFRRSFFAEVVFCADVFFR